MPIFNYKVKEKDNNIVESSEEAKDKFDLASSLKSRGFIVISVSQLEESFVKKLYPFLSSFFARVTLENKINFARNIGVMIGSGISLSRALEVELKQNKNNKFNTVLLDILNVVKGGGLFSKAIGDHPKIFPKFFKEMVVSGEKSGKLEESLKLVTLQLSKDHALRKKVKGAMVYPTIVFASMIAVAILMMIYVVPSLVVTFKELNIKLPASTSFIIFLSSLIQKSGFLFLIVAAGLFYTIFYFLKSEVGKKFLDYVFAYSPVVKNINRKFNAARVCRTLSSLISSGVDIVESLNITKELIDNHLYVKILDNALNLIKGGSTISKAFLAKESLYPPLVGEMMSVGEETGKISFMLIQLAQFYENEVRVATNELSTIIEPLLMIIVGVAVGFFAISMISPMYNLAGGF